MKQTCFQKKSTEAAECFFPVCSSDRAALSASPGKQHIPRMENLKRRRTRLQRSDDEQIWCLVSHLLLKDPCLIALLCQFRSLTVLKLTLLPMVCKKTVRKLTKNFQQNQMRFYVIPAFVINLELRPDLSKNVFSDSCQMFTLHVFQ